MVFQRNETIILPDFYERSGLMQGATIAKSLENKPFQAVSGMDVHIGDVSKTTIR